MAINLEPRGTDVSCVHDAFVQAYRAGLLESPADEIIYHLPDSFPLSSLQQLCSMLGAEFHTNCTSAVSAEEPLIYYFGNSYLSEVNGVGTGHAEFLRPRDLRAYAEERNHLQAVGFVAFRAIECSPFDEAPELHHQTSGMIPMQVAPRTLAA